MNNGKRYRLEAKALAEYNNAVAHWIDLPDYVSTHEYRDALLAWVAKHLDSDRTDVDFLITMALHHETGDRKPYFDFPRKVTIADNRV